MDVNMTHRLRLDKGNYYPVHIDYPSLEDAQWWKQIYESRGETVTIEELK